MNSAGSSCSAFGVPFRLAAGSESMLAAMLRMLPFGACNNVSPTPGEVEFALTERQDGMATLARGAEVLMTGEPLPAVLECLGRDLMVHVADHAPERVFVHAGVVGWRGRALLFPGSSFAGKTTLVAEFVRAGALYLSDEYALLDREGRVHPYPRDLHMRTPGRPGQTAVPVGALAGSAGTESLPVSGVLFARYRRGGVWKPEPVSAGMAVLEMLRHTIPVQRTPARVMATLARMMESALAWSSERGDARETVEAILLRGLAAEQPV